MFRFTYLMVQRCSPKSFLGEFVTNDLFAKEVRVATWTTIGTLAGLFVLITGGYGLVNGARDVRLDQLRRDGENRCVRGGSRLVDGQIDKAFINRLHQALETQLQQKSVTGKNPLQFSSYRHNEMVFRSADGYLLGIPGRTFKPGDPILANRPCWSADPKKRARQSRPETITLDAKPGLIVSQEFYEFLSYKDNAPVVYVSIGADLLPLPVLGVTEKPLPESLYFLWTERTQAWLDLVDRRLKAPEKNYSISVPADWISPPNIEPPVELTESLKVKGAGIAPRPVFRDGQLPGYSWDLEPLLDTSPFSLQEWRGLARFVSEFMVKQGKTALPEIADAAGIGRQIDPAGIELPDRKDEFVSVYAEDVDRLEEIALVMRRSEFLLKPNCEAARQRAEIGNQALMMLATLFGTILFAIVLGIGAVLAIEAMRADGRKAEIGMLRAIGMSNKVLNRIIVWETRLQILIAAGLAAVVTGPMGAVVVRLLYKDPLDRCLGFQSFSGGFWLVLLAALLVTIVVLPFATTIVNHRARRGDPAELIRF